ncbi:unnamed protein product (macronuclear) [Paramecium tetraurelia]|uniref:Tyrosine-protein phosphatase domain-containing protein n=1 Tax=Paramecium tetraurelia TaxID=5888 RepID=A0DJJ9_PARTE|nr:uncharacterized protein GSPATT00017560001 [Paramecium tetraurelia]CAK83216.1 unnamed protein product [Paramecium tetraurelia]|eukprot:XP_001450613.1 hypothetical protein (macronuclear) [Paramecium tetraurelia strain d4-2]
MNYDYIGAIKIKDGLFLGDQFAAQDLEFIVTNKVSRIINCASKQLPNHWESIGIVYLSFPWMDNDQQVIFQQDEIINNVMKFVDDALNNGESVIVLSVKGHNRSVATLCVYFMKKYRWTLYKTLQYMHNRRPDLEIRAHFFNQLLSVETRLQKQGYGAKTYNWDEIHTQGENDEIVLRNTYLNSQAQGVAEFKDHDPKPKESKLRFAEKVSMYIPPYDKVMQNQSQSYQVHQNKQIHHTSNKLKNNNLSPFRINPINNLKKIPKNKVIIKSILLNPKDLHLKALNNKDQLKVTVLNLDLCLTIILFVYLSQYSIEPQKVQLNNFMDSREQFLQKSQQQNGTRRPQTAPNQLKAPRVQTTPYKRNTSSGQRQEAGSQPNSQFKPMRQRAQSPNSAYNSSNPYVQRQFKAKAWKK